MTLLQFFDTNIVVYAAKGPENKRLKARELLIEGGFGSVQLLNEAVNVLFRKEKYRWDQVEPFLAAVKGSLEIIPVTLTAHEMAVKIAVRYGFHIYDSLLLASALEAGCTTFLSEDLHHGQVIDGRLTIENPFR